jgi:hypothetical protein
LVANDLGNLLSDARQKVAVEKVAKRHKKRLEPFLFDESQVETLDLFAKVVEQL